MWVSFINKRLTVEKLIAWLPIIRLKSFGGNHCLFVGTTTCHNLVVFIYSSVPTYTLSFSFSMVLPLSLPPLSHFSLFQGVVKLKSSLMLFLLLGHVVVCTLHDWVWFLYICSSSPMGVCVQCVLRVPRFEQKLS